MRLSGKVCGKEIARKHEEIVKDFVLILHLEKGQKITTEREELFKEIFITKRGQNIEG